MRKIDAITGALLLVFVTLLVPPTPASAQSSAAVTGIVFQDTNGNGVQDGDDAGLANVVIVAIEEDSGAPVTAVTGADGTYRIEADVINHRVRIDETSLPFNGELTTPQLEYNLNVPPGFTAPNVNFGYQEVAPSSATGIVFTDDNGNGTQDDSEAGLPGVVITVVHDETGAVTSLTTDAGGSYRFESVGSVNHRLSVDESTLPFNAQLTTGREEYNLNVPPGFTAPNVNFGYQEIEPAAAAGIVFNDSNGNGTQDDGESGLSGVTIAITHDETGALTTLTTDANGGYRFETAPRINHRVRVDETTLPFNAQLTTGREQYNLNVPPGFTAPNVNFGYQETQPAAAAGIVFNDSNGNGTQDDGESGLSGVTIAITHDETGALTTLTTDASGGYRFETTPRINHRLRVDGSTLPFTGQLTTGREQYNLNVPSGFTAPNINFGYQEIEPSAATGTVFEDLNANGQQDENEKGIPNVTLSVEHRASGDLTTITTASDGSYRYETSARRFNVSVDESTLPFADPVLTTTRETYSLNVPNGFVAPNVNFGYRAATPEDDPPLRAIGDTGGTGGTDDEPATEPDTAENSDNRANAFDDPDPQLPLPDDLPADAGEHATPREGTWTAYNEGLSLTCSGMSMNQPASPPETGTIILEDGGQTLIGTGYEGDTVVLTASTETRGLYTGTITITEQGSSATLDYFLQVVTPERIVGYLTGTVNAQGVSCEAYRAFHMEYSGS